MNLKKVLVSAVAGAAMMLSAFTGTSQALDVNIYGSSAQFLYWNAMMPNFLASKGCTNIQQAKETTNTFGITNATCATYGGTVTVRVTSKASFDGIESVMGNVDTNATPCPSSAIGYPGATLAPYYRLFADDQTPGGISWVSGGMGTVNSERCFPVTLGASDVGAQSFTQSSSGQKLGPFGGGAITRSFSGFNTPGTMHAYQPMVVPFGFFANPSVQHAVDNSGNPVAWGSAQDNGTHPAISNLSRIGALMIFGNQAYNWSDLGKDFKPQTIVACYRHAGSGTHATLNYAVMNPAWGSILPNAEITNATAQTNGTNAVYFNDGSNDEVNCVTGGTKNGIEWDAQGAIGYCDSDQPTGLNGTTTPLQGTTGWSHLVQLTYNGELPTRVNIRNGRYDFWTNEWLYYNTASTWYTPAATFIGDLMTYAAQPSTIPTASAWGQDKTGYWATQCEMTYEKATDQAYPSFVGATCTAPLP